MTVLWASNTVDAPQNKGGGPVLESGQSMFPGDVRFSPDGRFFVIFQTDGNVVQIRFPDTVLWATATNDRGATEFAMQADGNLVVYAGPTPLWASNTEGNPGAHLVIQNDGNLVLYSSSFVEYLPVWSIPPNWQDGIGETLEWRTSVQASARGAEQRRGMRLSPRRSFEVTFTPRGPIRTLFDLFIMRAGGSEIYFPVWPDVCHLTAAPYIPPPRPWAEGPLILNGLITNSYHEEYGRGGYFYHTSGTSEGEGLFILACYHCFEALNQTDPGPAAYYRTLAETMLDALDGYSPPAPPGSSVLPVSTEYTDFVTAQAAILYRGPFDYETAEIHKSRPTQIALKTAVGAWQKGEKLFPLIRADVEVQPQAQRLADRALHSRVRFRSTEKNLIALGVSDASPILRQPIGDDPDYITLLHWLFAARGPIPLQEIVYDFYAVDTGGTLYINQHAAAIVRVFQIYPTTSELLYTSPFSPTFDIENPTGETQVVIDNLTGWHYNPATDQVEVPIPAAAPDEITEWYVVYAYNGPTVLPIGSAYEAYPVWTAIPDGYSACAPDTFRWFDQAFTKAIQHDTRVGHAEKWTELRAALRRTAVKGQNLSDLREVFKPMPNFPAIPATGDPTGMFCFSNHPAAAPPPPGKGDPNWLGFNFWSRNPEGDIIGRVPNATGAPQVQIGRGFNDEWRTAQTYQDPDQYILVSLCCTKAPDEPAEHFYVFVSSSKNYSPDTRWYADIGHYAGFVATPLPALTDGSGMREFLVPRTDFLRLDFDGAVLPESTYFENYGITMELNGSYTVRLSKLRPVSGPSPAWVADNYSKAIQGSQLPFFPGSMPFAINADTIRQQFVGYNGSPFHGYQLLDYWMVLEGDAIAIHGSLDVGDLPIPNPSNGAIEHPMVLTDSEGTDKPLHALLMEQQCRFLQAAQQRYVLDGGMLGPFAHTFVLNTAARRNIGFPVPHTWVYTNDDPNTRWIGYQCRVVEALAYATLVTKGVPGFADVHAMARILTFNWINWLRSYWPNLGGTPYRGMPTDYPDPRISPPLTLYEEPHGPGIVMRACLWLKKADPGLGALCDEVQLRCWQYIEMIFVHAEGEMKWTWSPLPGTYTWYGFWHGEIIDTLALLLLNAGDVAAGIDLETVRLRLVQTQSWLENVGVENR